MSIITSPLLYHDDFSAVHRHYLRVYAIDAFYCLGGYHRLVPVFIDYPVFQKQEKQEKMDSFYAVLHYATDYFWHFVEDPILRSHTVYEIVHFALRMLMQDREVLYPCSKSMGAYIERMENKPPKVLELCRIFVENPTTENMENFVQYVLSNIDYEPPKDFHDIGTRFVADNEQWWYKQRPFIAEW